MLKIRDVFTILLLFIAWIILSGRLTFFNLVLGIIVSTAVVLVIHSSFTRKFAYQIITNGLYFIAYVALVAVEVFKSSYKVAYFVLHPKLSFNPGIVKVPTKLGTKDRLIKLTVAANTITLTPGTITVDIDTENDELYIHWINVKADEPEEIRHKVIARFEKLIRRIFT